MDLHLNLCQNKEGMMEFKVLPTTLKHLTIACVTSVADHWELNLVSAESKPAKANSFGAVLERGVGIRTEGGTNNIAHKYHNCNPCSRINRGVSAA